MSNEFMECLQSRRIENLDPVRGKRVFSRADLNVPVTGGKITDTTRIDRTAKGIAALAAKGGRVIVASHFGRPKGKRVAEMSLEPVARALAEATGIKVQFAPDCIGEVAEQAVGAMKDGEILLLENLRFHEGEEANDPAFTDALAGFSDIYVNDAFSCSHRKHASIDGLARKLPAYAGALLFEELEALNRALENPERPVVAVVGGAKVSTKLAVLENLARKVDTIIIGGAMANTFLKAQGFNVGKSLVEDDMLETAKKIMQSDCQMILPEDVVVATEFKVDAENRTAKSDSVKPDEMILDIGDATVSRAVEKIGEVKTLIWNGPMGAFETKPFDRGTVALANAVAEYTKTNGLISVAGGGDTVAVLNETGVADSFTYISSAGGAFLEWMEGKKLPGITALLAESG